MKNKLLIVWSTAELAVAKKLVLLYGSVIIERGYWDEAHLMVWGPSAKILAIKEDLQAMVKTMQDQGIKVSACRVCTEDYNVTEKLESLNIDVTHTGEFLTHALQNDWKVITF